MLPDIGLIGNKRAGKDTIADYLVERYGYVKLSFAEPLRQLTAEINPSIPGYDQKFNDFTDNFGYEHAKDNIPGYREFLEDLGLGARKVLGDDVWIDAFWDRYYSADPDRPVVVTDCRFDNEADTLKDMAFSLVHVVRPDAPHPGDHESESRIQHLARTHASGVLQNAGDLEDLFSIVDGWIANYQLARRYTVGGLREAGLI